MVYTYYHGPRRITKARHLRKTQTRAEAIVWDQLRNRKVSGFKFRRQQILNERIVDFFCAEVKLIVEVDGPYHNDPIQKTKDAKTRAFWSFCQSQKNQPPQNNTQTEANLQTPTQPDPHYNCQALLSNSQPKAPHLSTPTQSERL